MRVELWVGLVHVRALPAAEVDEGDGAFVTVVAHARDAGEFEERAREAVASEGFDYLDAESVDPLAQRLESGRYAGELVELAVDAAAAGETAVGTFHVYPADAPDAGTEWTSEERLRDARANGELVDVDRFGADDSIGGYVVDITDELAVLHELSNDITLDGYSVVRVRDVEDVAPRGDDYFGARALQLLGLDPVTPNLDASSVSSVLRGLQQQDELVTIHVEKVAPDVVYIGKVERVEDVGVLLRLIGSDAEWLEPTFYDFREITRISFGGRYEAALLMVARDREQES
jgi:hypothetical protein